VLVPSGSLSLSGAPRALSALKEESVIMARLLQGEQVGGSKWQIHAQVGGTGGRQ
jgi:hypothetical protein